jgi:multiple sugar transport system substrate-binding protein
MSKSIQIRGIGWDHPRCMSPLTGSIYEFNKMHPQVEIIWNTRSLYDFGEGNLQELLDDYDLIIFDHPYVGDISNNDWFINLADEFTSEEMLRFENDSIGPSWQSYQTTTGIWGIPIDAAAQVASYRPDLMEKLDCPPPRTIADAVRLAKKARDYDLWVALPLAQCDAICTFMALAANTGHAIARDGSSFPEYDICNNILAIMKELAELIHPESLKWNPIKCYDHMSTHDDVCYVPFAFGYTNYSRNSSPKIIQYCDIPGIDSHSCSGAVLGGAGIGISARSKNPDISIEYAKFLCEPDYQCSKYYIDGGQPASLSAWQNKTNDANATGFFSGTISTMENAYLRPTFSGFVHYFRDAGKQINAYLRDEISLSSTSDWLITNYSKLT